MSESQNMHEQHRIRERAAMYRDHDSNFAVWAEGSGVVAHDDLTQVRVYDMIDMLAQRGHVRRDRGGLRGGAPAHARPVLLRGELTAPMRGPHA